MQFCTSVWASFHPYLALKQDVSEEGLKKKKRKRHFIVSALNILKWVFSELICCATMEKKTLQLYSKVALSALCALALSL